MDRVCCRLEVLKVFRGSLSNGLRLIVLQLPHLHSVTESFAVRAGPRHEAQDEGGLSHLVEHLLFRGTERLPDSYLLNTAIEALGGEINGLTHRDATSIDLTVPTASSEAGLAILGNICAHPLMTGLDVERSVVIEEILDSCDGDGVETDIDTIAKTVLWSGHPMARPVAGTAEEVESLTETHCRDHHRRLYVAENGVLCVAGPVDPLRIRDVAELAFAGLPRGSLPASPPPPAPARDLPIHLREVDGAQVSALLSFPAPHENDPRFPALMLLGRLLDDGFGSRLRQAISEQSGLAYSVAGAIDAYADAAVLDVEATCAPHKLVRMVVAMKLTLERLAREGPSPEEIERAKIRQRAESEFGLDDPGALSSWYSATELIGCSSSYEDRLREISLVSRDEVAELAREMLRPERALLTLVGPVEPSTLRTLENAMERTAGSSVHLGSEEEPEEPVLIALGGGLS